MYGLTLLVAIAVCTWVTGRRWVNRGGDWDLIFRCAVWGVAAGIVGARLYHVITSWDEVPDEWWGVFAIWRGGLGVWGGIALGCLVGGIVAKRAGADVWLLADCLAPGLLARAGDRAARQLVEPGALRQADRPAVGARDRPGNRPVAYLDRDDLPPDVPLRADLGLRGRGRARLRDRAAVPAPPAGVFARYIALYCVGRFGRGAPARRPRAPHRGAAAQRLGVADRDRRRRDLVRPLAAQTGRARRSRGSARSRRSRRRRWPSRAGGASDRPARFARVASAVRDLELDLDAFEGPFDLLLTLSSRSSSSRRRSTSRRSSSRSSST